MSKWLVREGERVKCPHSPDIRAQLVAFALDQREEMREIRLQMAWFDDHPEAPNAGTPEERAAAIKKCDVMQRAVYRDLRRKAESLSEELLDGVERYLEGALRGDTRRPEDTLTVRGVSASQIRHKGKRVKPVAVRSRPPWARRGRLR